MSTSGNSSMTPQPLVSSDLLRSDLINCIRSGGLTPLLRSGSLTLID